MGSNLRPDCGGPTVLSAQMQAMPWWRLSLPSDSSNVKTACPKKDSTKSYFTKITDAGLTTFPVAHSKFGQSFDGLHTFDAVRNSSYGDPYAFMKRAISDRIITEALKQKIGTPRVLKKPVWRK